MDYECIETWLELPEFRVIGQVIGPTSWNCTWNDATRTSFVPAVRDVVLGSKRVESGVFVICPSWIAP
jgi:hypothetical protein